MNESKSMTYSNEKEEAKNVELLLSRFGRPCHCQAGRAQFWWQFRPGRYNFSKLSQFLCAQLCVGGFFDFRSGGVGTGLEKSEHGFDPSPGSSSTSAYRPALRAGHC